MDDEEDDEDEERCRRRHFSCFSFALALTLVLRANVSDDDDDDHVSGRVMQVERAIGLRPRNDAGTPASEPLDSAVVSPTGSVGRSGRRGRLPADS